MSAGRLHRRLTLLAATLLVCACASTEEKPDGPIIDDLKIEGAKQISERKVKKKILTEESSWLPYWVPLLGNEAHFDENAWQADLRRIERFYQTNGYYQAHVLEDEVTPTKDGHVKIRVLLEEGGLAKISRLTVEGLEPLEEKQRVKILDDLPVKMGGVFLEDEWESTKQLLKTGLLELGYAEAQVEGEAIVDIEKLAAELELYAEAGNRYKFGKTFVATDANNKVPAKVIAGQVAEEIKEGDWFNPQDLADAQSRVFQMGVFSAVKVNRGAPDKSNGTVPVVVDVREAPFRSLRAGGGIGADQLRNEARLIGEFTHRNFLGGLRRYTIRAKVGWAFLPNVVEVARNSATAQHGPIFRVLNEFEQPRFFFNNVNMLASLDVLRQLEAGFNSIGGTARLGFAWKPSTHITITPSYNFSYYRLSTPVSLGTIGGQDLFYGCNQDCFISYFEQTINWDRRDSVLEPKNGWYLGLTLQEGGNISESFFTFLKVLPEARGYVSFTKDDKVTLAGRVRAGSIIQLGTSDTAIPVRFFSGGNDMRGFGARRLSPYDVPACTADQAMEDGNNCAQMRNDAIPVGGNSLVEGSFEVRWNLWGDLTLAIFYDVGFVSAETLNAKIFGKLNHAVGFGARYRTPIGPIRLDLAFRLPTGAPLEQYRPLGTGVVTNPWGPNNFGGCFGLGNTGSTWAGSPEGVCGFHLSIGEAF